MKILALDPANVLTAFVVYDEDTKLISDKGKVENAILLDRIRRNEFDVDMMAVEMIACYGMSVGKTVFETCVWIGKFVEAWDNNVHKPFEFIYRLEVKMNLCHSAKAKDKNIRVALIDRMGEQGTKKNPGPTYGISADIWAALGVAVTSSDKRKGVSHMQ